MPPSMSLGNKKSAASVTPLVHSKAQSFSLARASHRVSGSGELLYLFRSIPSSP